MNTIVSFCFIGGDLRQIHVANLISSMGYKVTVIGFDKCETGSFSDNITVTDNLSLAINNKDIIVLPLPYTTDGVTIKTPFSNTIVHIKDVLELTNSSQRIFVGKNDDVFQNMCNEKNIHLVDYLEREELSILNAIPTAEGALALAMNETPFTIHGSECLCLGFGRIGKVLANMLKGVGANVSVEARKISDLAWIKTYGYNAVPLDCLEYEVNKFDIIFNTIPHTVLDFKILSKLKKDCLIIDLASKPGGVDFEVAKELSVNVIWALSLPGKVAPLTAGKIICDTFINILKELGV